MKKVMAFLLAVMMCCGSALAESNVGCTVKMQVDWEQTVYLLQAGVLNTGNEITDEQLNKLETMITLLNDFSLYGETDGCMLRGMGILKEQSLFFAESDGNVMQSSLLPGIALELPEEAVNQITPQSRQEAKEKLYSKLEKLSAEWKADLESHCVQREDGEFGVEALGGMLIFQHRAEYAFTVGELADEMEKLLSRAVHYLQAYLQEIGISEDMIRLNGRVKKPEDEAVLESVIGLTLYREKTEDGFARYPFFLEANMLQQENITLQLAMINGWGEAMLTGGAAPLNGETTQARGQASWVWGETEEETYFTLDVMVNGMPIGLDLRKYPRMDGGSETWMGLYVKEEKPLVQTDIAFLPLTEPLKAVETGERERISLSAMDEETKKKLQLEWQMGLNSVLVNAIQAAPEEMQALMNAWTVQPE